MILLELDDALQAFPNVGLGFAPLQRAFHNFFVRLFLQRKPEAAFLVVAPEVDHVVDNFLLPYISIVVNVNRLACLRISESLNKQLSFLRKGPCLKQVVA